MLTSQLDGPEGDPPFLSKPNKCRLPTEPYVVIDSARQPHEEECLEWIETHKKS